MWKFQPLKPEVKFKKGLTLIEVLVAISLSVVLLGAIYGVYVTSYKSYRRNVSKAEINQNARIALERISRDLRQAERIITNLPPENTDPLNPPPSTIKFQDGHNVNQVQYLEYSLNGSELKRKLTHYYFSSDPATWVTYDAQDEYGNLPQETIDEESVKADKISDLQFYGDKLVTIEIIASQDGQSQSYQTQTLGRNVQ